jgi:aryl carrier-like protein
MLKNIQGIPAKAAREPKEMQEKHQKLKIEENKMKIGLTSIRTGVRYA